MKSFGIPDEIHSYAAARSSGDDVADRLAAVTVERFGGAAAMNIGADQGRFMQSLAESMRATSIVEVGTFTGMSALWLAQGMSPDGEMVCFDITDRYEATAREAWDAAGVSERIELRVGPAADRLTELAEQPHIDIAFIDADKTGYRTYLDLLLPRMSDHGVVLVDNVLWSGAVIDDSDTSADTVALRDFNDHVAARADCVSTILTIGDGVTMIRPRR